MQGASTVEIIGTAADVVAGVGTMGALVVAAGAYRQQVKQNRRAQASAVTVSGVTPEGEDARTNKQSVALTNHSSLPAYFAMQCVFNERRKDWIELGSGVEVGPGERHVFEPYDTMENLKQSPDFMGVHFSDASGCSWLRTNDGFLLEASCGPCSSPASSYRPLCSSWRSCQGCPEGIA